MTTSEKLISDIKDNLFSPGVPLDLRDDVLKMIDEYREAVRSTIRLENTIHLLRKL